MAREGDENSSDPEELTQVAEDALGPFRAGVIDELFAVSIRERRERAKMSQSELSRRMAALGWQYYPQTVQRVESGQRKVSIGEAEALGRILETTVARLMMPGQQANLATQLERLTVEVLTAWDQVSGWAESLVQHQQQLARTVSEAEESAFRDSEPIVSLLTEARRALAMTVEGAVADGRAPYPESLIYHPSRDNPEI